MNNVTLNKAIEGAYKTYARLLMETISRRGLLFNYYIPTIYTKGSKKSIYLIFYPVSSNQISPKSYLHVWKTIEQPSNKGLKWQIRTIYPQLIYFRLVILKNGPRGLCIRLPGWSFCVCRSWLGFGLHRAQHPLLWLIFEWTIKNYYSYTTKPLALLYHISMR